MVERNVFIEGMTGQMRGKARVDLHFRFSRSLRRSLLVCLLACSMVDVSSRFRLFSFDRVFTRNPSSECHREASSWMANASMEMLVHAMKIVHNATTHHREKHINALKIREVTCSSSSSFLFLNPFLSFLLYSPIRSHIQCNVFKW